MLWHRPSHGGGPDWVTEGAPVGQFYGLGGHWTLWEDLPEIIKGLGKDSPAGEVSLRNGPVQSSLVLSHRQALQALFVFVCCVVLRFMLHVAHEREGTARHDRHGVYSRERGSRMRVASQQAGRAFLVMCCRVWGHSMLRCPGGGGFCPFLARRWAENVPNVGMDQDRMSCLQMELTRRGGGLREGVSSLFLTCSQ